ncbi:hypothetical protein COS66_03150 [Candidatus Berkelbacteria bacterium CG06_land_8_20_14_3_00_43_10]|nr:MAG: hypothetical protein COS66_03150 [Candidatus Berkelbacteria bacterium CG06_land_8_20_14_3_00_43_10]
MSEKLPSDQNIESEELERESLIKLHKDNLLYLFSRECDGLKKENPDGWEVSKILTQEAIKILEENGLIPYKSWFKQNWSPLNQRDSQNFSRLGTVHMAKLAKEEEWTVNQFLREHLLARAQGEAVRKEIENEKREKPNKTDI